MMFFGDSVIDLGALVKVFCCLLASSLEME